MLENMKFMIMQRVTYAILFSLLLCGCTSGFESMNTNPNAATTTMMQADNLLTGSFFVQMEKNVFVVGEGYDGDYQIIQNLAGDVYSGQFGSCGLWYSNQNNTTYKLISSWYNDEFNRAYTNIMTPWYSIKEVAQDESPQTVALATIVKVAAMDRCTDMYGPIPYKNFGNGSLQSSYDSQKDVYYAFFDELNDAITTLTDFHTKNSDATILADYDFIYSGNVASWIKFANSLKLRLAMRLAYVDPTKAQEEAESAVSQSIGVMTSASDVAELQHTTSMSYNHPIYKICYSFDETRMGAMMDSYLNGYKDPRISAYFVAASDGVYRGIRNGINITTKATYSEGPFSKINFTASTPMVWMQPAEVYFLRAEGALRGWNMGGTAQSFYETGIKTSFTYWGVSGVDTYIADATSVPAAYTDPQNSGNNASALSMRTIKWDDAATTEQKLERIIIQKWIAIFPDGQEAWSEYRRTGYPKMFPVVVNYSGGTISTDTQIRRLPFPSTEYTSNATEVAKAVNLLGGSDNGGTKLWWDKK
jgi:hypothetical protein